jgi:hypothetical protein
MGSNMVWKDLRSLLAKSACMNHQNFLGHLDMALAIWHADFLGRLYNSAKFLNMGANRLRCVMLLTGPRIRDFVSFEVGFADPIDKAFQKEVVDYVRTWQSEKQIDGRSHADIVQKYFDLVGGGYNGKKCVVLLEGTTFK